MKRLRLFYLFTLLPFFCACTTDVYEKGTGTYSLMHTDLAEATIDGEKYAVNFITDEGNSYTLSPKYQGKWIQTADTTYRVIAYYTPHDDGTAEAVAAARPGGTGKRMGQHQW